MGSVGQMAASSCSSNFENDSNLVGLEPGPHALAQTLAAMAKAADFLRPPTLTKSNFAAL